MKHYVIPRLNKDPKLFYTLVQMTYNVKDPQVLAKNIIALRKERFANIGPLLASQFPNLIKSFYHNLNSTSPTFNLTDVQTSEALNIL